MNHWELFALGLVTVPVMATICSLIFANIFTKVFLKEFWNSTAVFIQSLEEQGVFHYGEESDEED